MYNSCIALVALMIHSFSEIPSMSRIAMKKSWNSFAWYSPLPSKESIWLYLSEVGKSGSSNQQHASVRRSPRRFSKNQFFEWCLRVTIAHKLRFLPIIFTSAIPCRALRNGNSKTRTSQIQNSRTKQGRKSSDSSNLSRGDSHWIGLANRSSRFLY